MFYFDYVWIVRIVKVCICRQVAHSSLLVQRTELVHGTRELGWLLAERRRRVGILRVNGVEHFVNKSLDFFNFWKVFFDIWICHIEHIWRMLTSWHLLIILCEDWRINAEVIADLVHEVNDRCPSRVRCFEMAALRCGRHVLQPIVVVVGRSLTLTWLVSAAHGVRNGWVIISHRTIFLTGLFDDWSKALGIHVGLQLLVGTKRDSLLQALLLCFMWLRQAARWA